MPDTPSVLTRYAACEDWSGPCNPVVNVTGDWVRYSEAAALEQRCRELEAQNERLRDALQGTVDSHYALVEGARIKGGDSGRLVRKLVDAAFGKDIGRARAALSGDKTDEDVSDSRG